MSIGIIRVDLPRDRNGQNPRSLVYVNSHGLYGLTPPVYIDTGGARVVQSRFTEKGNRTSGCQTCHPRKGESHPDTGEGLLPCIFTAHQSVPYHTV